MSPRPGDGILVVSCYELGHQPLAAATAMAFLERAGFRPRAVDLATQRLDAAGDLSDLRLAVVLVPMHTALRIGVRAAAGIRRAAPAAHVSFHGLYAWLNAGTLLADGVADSVAGGETEGALVELARALAAGRPAHEVAGLTTGERRSPPLLDRLDWLPPSRDGLPPPERYARLVVGGEQRIAAAVETTRGCLHHCRHCPIPPVYGGRLVVVPRAHVLEDVRRLAARGVRHVTFADPDFLCGPGHALAIVREMHSEHPSLTFDATIKIEHLLKHRRVLDELARRGCLFVVSAVESLSDAVLDHLDKGHRRADVFEALALLRRAGITLRPSLVAFTPWTTLGDYLEVLDWIEEEGLAHQVDPVQLSIRLLVPPGSLLADSAAMRPHLRGFDAGRFTWRWTHPDPRMDRLHAEVDRTVRDAVVRDEPAGTTFGRVRRAAERLADATGRPAGATAGGPRRPSVLPAGGGPHPPRLTEPWFC